MKIILIGANGKIGELVQKALAGTGYEIVKSGRKSGDFQVEIENRESVRKLYAGNRLAVWNTLSRLDKCAPAM